MKTEKENSRRDFILSLPNTYTGKRVKEYLFEWEDLKSEGKSNRKPWKRGLVYCLGYFNCCSPSEPLITIGPDWKFSVAEIVLINMFLSLPLLTFDHNTKMFQATRILMLVQNISFLATFLSNPGMLPVDPSIHSD